MGIEVELTKNIFAEADTVWELLENPLSWKSWWSDCVDAKTLDDRSLREGSSLEVVLQPRHMKITLNPVVDLYTERKTLSLTHHSALIHSTTVWQLVERPNGLKVSTQIVFNGILPFFITIAQQSSIVRLSLGNNLKGLKRAAEQRI